MLVSSDHSAAALSCLPAEVRALASRSAYLTQLRNGQRIVEAGIPPIGPMFVASGAMAVGRRQADGQDVVMCFARQHIWQMGQLVATGCKPVYDSYAVGKAEVIVWPRDSFMAAYEQHQSLREFIRNTEVKVQQNILRELENSLALTLPQRLARRLLELADMIGRPQEDKSVRLAAPVSHALLAASLGVTRQRVHGQIREWSALGWIESSYRDVILHAPDALRNAAAFA